MQGPGSGSVSVEVQPCYMLEEVVAMPGMDLAVKLLFFLLQFRNPVVSVAVP